MPVEVLLETPLANALNACIQPKLTEVGWSAGDDATALSEYIILMLVNGKNQEQIASELAGDLLQLGPDDPGARDFSQWLFHQIEVLDAQLNGGRGTAVQVDGTGHSENMGLLQSQDAEMGDVSDASGNVPTGPRSMRNGNLRGTGREKRMMHHLSKAMDRSHEPVLHRVRPQSGNERIGRGATPNGPRQHQAPGRGALRAQSNRMHNGMGMPTQQGSAATTIMNMGPQQQLELYAMLEQQSRMMAQIMGSPAQMGRNGAMAMVNGNGYHPQNNGRPSFDRAQPHARGGQKNFTRGRGSKFYENKKHASTTDPSSIDVEMSVEKKELDPENTTCKYNLSCTNKDCKFAHQSPEAPLGMNIDYKDICSFGAACKNRKCTGKHPSPAQKIAHQTEMDCKYFPNCTNPRCPFRHPAMPLCRNGADCTTPDCKFTHVKTMCKFNPCLNPVCTFKHSEGQQRGKFEDKVWTAGGVKAHVSERKFVDENGPEELIVPGSSEVGGLSQASMKTEVITT